MCYDTMVACAARLHSSESLLEVSALVPFLIIASWGLNTLFPDLVPVSSDEPDRMAKLDAGSRILIRQTPHATLDRPHATQ